MRKQLQGRRLSLLLGRLLEVEARLKRGAQPGDASATACWADRCPMKISVAEARSMALLVQKFGGTSVGSVEHQGGG